MIVASNMSLRRSSLALVFSVTPRAVIFLTARVFVYCVCCLSAIVFKATMNHEILLYYKYVTINNPEELMEAHKAFGVEHNLKGRVIIAKEGINGTLEGTKEASEAYQKWLTSDPRFADMWFKKSPGTGSAFPKWSVKVRPEIVSLHLGEHDFSPTDTTGKYLKPEQLHEWIESGKDITIVDMRNEYEFKVGNFIKSFVPGLKNFRDLRETVNLLKDKKDGTVITVCTGGVRCEKASGLLVKDGFKDVYQLEGGIVTYMEKFPMGYFKGKLYVFDGRVVMGVPGGEDQEVVGRCDKCHTPCERYINCSNLMCHDHIILCESCDKKGLGTCSTKCAYKVKTNRMLNQIKSWTNQLVSKR